MVEPVKTVSPSPPAAGGAKTPIMSVPKLTPSTPPTQALTPSASKPVVLKGPPPFSLERTSTAGSRWLKLMVYGMPGAGKTTLLGSAADVEDMRDILYVDCEKGFLAIEDNDRIKNPIFVAENRISCTKFKTAAQVHDFLKAHCKYRDENNIDKMREVEAWLRGCSIDEIEEPKRFRTVMIDSLTELDTYCTYDILGVTQEKVLDEAGGDIDVAGWPEFRKNNQMMQMLCRAFRDLPIHFIASAGRAYAEDEKKRRYYAPALTGALRTQIPGFFDIVGFMQIEKVGENHERRLYVKPVGSTNFEAKNRRPVFKPDYFKDPVMADIMQGIGLLK